MGNIGMQQFPWQQMQILLVFYLNGSAEARSISAL
jgi:hypothetical protein